MINAKYKRFVLILLLLAMLVGSSVSMVQGQEPVKIVLWTFADTLARWYETMAEQYRADVNPDFELEVVQIAFTDMHERLLLSLQTGVGAPDMADIEQGQFGSFLRGGDPGLVDLAPLLEAGGYTDKIVPERQALYAWQGKQYGLELGLTPVVLYYRPDIWAQYGHDPAEFETWDDFVAAAQDVVAQNPDVVPLPLYWELHSLLLRQRGGDYFDVDGNVTIDSDLSIDTLQWMVDQLNAGIAKQQPDVIWAAFKDNTLISHVAADWYGGWFKDNAPEMSGLWKAAPLPAWEPGGRRTSVFGGTDSTIIASSPHVDEAWKFMQYAALTTEGRVLMFQGAGIYPPLYSAMEDERLHFPDEYFSGQDLGALFQSLAPDTPPQYQSPARTFSYDAFSAAFQDVLDGNRTPEDVLREVADSTRFELES